MGKKPKNSAVFKSHVEKGCELCRSNPTGGGCSYSILARTDKMVVAALLRSLTEGLQTNDPNDDIRQFCGDVRDCVNLLLAYFLTC